VGYCFGIRSERRLCEEVQLNLAYRWFCRLGLEDQVPDHSTFSKNRHGRFRDSDTLRFVFEQVLERCVREGLVGGEGFAIDASLVKADANRQRGVPGDKADWSDWSSISRPVREYLAALDQSELDQERGTPLHDSKTFRRRLHQYLTNNNTFSYGYTVEIFEREFGLDADNVEKEFMSVRVPLLLSIITAASDDCVERAQRNHGSKGLYFDMRVRLLRFVGRALQEENLAYEVDEQGGVHPLIDTEFQHNRQTAIAALGLPRYVNVANSLQNAFDRITVVDTDTKAAVRDIFDAAESLFKLVLAPAQRREKRRGETTPA
jgi:hypothetical protein